jgi:hypothetical protein
MKTSPWCCRRRALLCCRRWRRAISGRSASWRRLRQSPEDRDDDVLTVYAHEFEALGVANDRDGPETLCPQYACECAALTLRNAANHYRSDHQ